MLIGELATGQITGTLKDADLVRIPGTDLSTFTFTLYDKITRAIINSRSAVNVLTMSGASVSSASGTEGDFVIPLAAADNAIVNTARQNEEHVALLRFSTASENGWAEVLITVKNSLKIT